MKFTPEMFKELFRMNEHGFVDECAVLPKEVSILVSETAQAAFDKWLSEQPVVYGEWELEYTEPGSCGLTTHQSKNDTHVARLVDVKRIK